MSFEKTYRDLHPGTLSQASERQSNIGFFCVCLVVFVTFVGSSLWLDRKIDRLSDQLQKRTAIAAETSGARVTFQSAY